jgi:adenosine deaminase
MTAPKKHKIAKSAKKSAKKPAKKISRKKGVKKSGVATKSSLAAVLALPKVELHRHLELSLRPSTIRELAPSFGIDVPDERTFNARFIIEKPMRDLGQVLSKFLDTQLLLASEEILERITYEACIDAFKEGVRVLELRYAPTFVRNRHEHLSFQMIHNAINKGARRAEADFPIAVGLICIIQRILPVKEAEKVTNFAIDNKDSFVGIDLADNEEGFDSKPFAPFFARAKDAGLGITIHAGEVNLPKAPRYVKDAIEHLGASRIGHGVQIYRDQAMIDYVIRKGVVLELCATSNHLTQAIPGGLKNLPFRKLFQAGVRVAFGTDDPGIFNTDLLKEYKILNTVCGFTVDELTQCNHVAAHASFISQNKIRAVWPIHSSDSGRMASELLSKPLAR